MRKLREITLTDEPQSISYALIYTSITTNTAPTSRRGSDMEKFTYSVLITEIFWEKALPVVCLILSLST